MQLQKEVYLSPGPGLQIRYPGDWNGEKSGDEDAAELFISTQPKYLTPQEIALVEQYLTTIQHRRKLILTGAVIIDPEDPLLSATHDQLDAIESQEGYSNSKFVPGGGVSLIYTRVLLIREKGYLGDKYIAIKGTK